jgi:hypothetical protein
MAGEILQDGPGPDDFAGRTPVLRGQTTVTAAGTVSGELAGVTRRRRGRVGAGS